MFCSALENALEHMQYFLFIFKVFKLSSYHTDIYIN